MKWIFVIGIIIGWVLVMNNLSLARLPYAIIGIVFIIVSLVGFLILIFATL